MHTHSLCYKIILTHCQIFSSDFTVSRFYSFLYATFQYIKQSKTSLGRWYSENMTIFESFQWFNLMSTRIWTVANEIKRYKIAVLYIHNNLRVLLHSFHTQLIDNWTYLLLKAQTDSKQWVPLYMARDLFIIAI